MAVVPETFARTAIMAALETALSAIGNGDQKWANERQPIVHRLRSGGFHLTSFPAIKLYPAPSTSRHIANSGTSFRSRVDQEVRIQIEDYAGEDAELAMDKWEHDVRLAIDEDFTLGNTCLKAEIRHVTPWIDDEDDPTIGLDVSLVARFRYTATDPSQQSA